MTTKATYRVPFDDFDYERWAATLGLVATHEPAEDGDFLLHVEGEQSAIDQFSAELSWAPEP